MERVCRPTSEMAAFKRAFKPSSPKANMKERAELSRTGPAYLLYEKYSLYGYSENTPESGRSSAPGSCCGRFVTPNVRRP
jgi:hypothetical protein